jgi:alpha-methylacyl-CoA racemase
MLDGIRVIDTTRLLPGPYASWLMARMGADVVKVEQPGKGDYIRHNYPRRGGTSTVFHLYNEGKRSVALNLKSEDGREAFLDLVAGADVVLDGNRPGVLDRLGCGWEACRERRAQLVFAAITGFGQEGPYRERVGHDVNYLSLAGVLSALADGSGRPILPRITIADMAGGGLMSAVGVLAALIAARESGEGRFVDVSMTDSVLSMQGLRLAEDLFPGEARPADLDSPEGDDWEYGVYETADGGYVSIDPYENRFKEVLWSAVEAEGLGPRPDRGGGREHVYSALASAIAQRPRARWDELLGEAEVCYAPVYDLADLPDDPSVSARGLLGNALDADEANPTIASPMRFEPPVRVDSPARAPALGADTVPLLSEAGWDRERIDAALASGALAAATAEASHG